MEISIEQLRAYLTNNPVPRLSDSSGQPIDMVRDEELIEKYLRLVGIRNQFAIDIAASNGLTMSNTVRLYSLFNWRGLALEYGVANFAELATTYKCLPQVNLARCKVTPENILSLLQAFDVPKDPDFLSLDIDSFDYFILERILERYRPRLIVCEINERLPPPLKFTVCFAEDFPADSSFYGMSLTMAADLAVRNGYKLIDYNYNNAYFAPTAIDTVAAISPEQAYEQGYRGRSDRPYIFSYNQEFEHLLNSPPDETAKWFSQYWRRFEGKYLLSY